MGGRFREAKGQSCRFQEARDNLPVALPQIRLPICSIVLLPAPSSALALAISEYLQCLCMCSMSQAISAEGRCKPSIVLQILKTRTGYTKPPVSLVGQMFWREFFYTVGHATPNFEKMEGNPISKQVRFAVLCYSSSAS